MYSYISEVHRKEFDAALYNYVVDVAHSLDGDVLSGRKSSADFLSGTELILPFSLGQTLLQVHDPEGKVLIRSKSLGRGVLPLASLAPGLQKDPLFGDVRLNSELHGDGRNRYRMVSHVFHQAEFGDFVVQAAVPMILLDRQREGLLMFFALAVPLTLGLAGLAGLLFSRKAMAPVAAIIQKANEIEARHLGDLIPVPECRDEIRELALTLNGLLHRLEKAFKSQEDFIADASHQLKTPLAILKGELDLFSSKTNDPGELNLFLESARQEINDLSRMVEDLLVLARADRYGGAEFKSRFRVDEKIMESVSRFSRFAEQKKINLTVDLHPASDPDADFEFEGEPELIRSLIENLLDNAIKYSQSGGTISVVLEDKVNSLVLKVSDGGPGISRVVLPHIFKRFYRSDLTRNTVGGSGLGLSIVKKIAEIHGGQIEAQSTEGVGTVFTLSLPRETKVA